MNQRPNELAGQLDLVCEQCNGQRIIASDDTPSEVCDWCDGTGIDPGALPPVSANRIDELSRGIDEKLKIFRRKAAG